MGNKKGSLAARINFGGKNKAQAKPQTGTQRSYGAMQNTSLDKAKKNLMRRKGMA